MPLTAPPAVVTEPEFELDVSVVESTPVDGDLMYSTDNGCGGTSDSACVTCFHG